MKTDHPLSGLFDRCQTLCVAECCGIAAFDFSPVHIASFLLMHKGAVDEAEVAHLRSQLEALKANYGSRGASARGVTLDELNQGFSADEVEVLVEKISANLDAAVTLAETMHRAQTS